MDMNIKLMCITHDVDSIRQSIRHILRRYSRFRLIDLLKHVLKLTNLYNNIHLVVDLEERYGIRSTWFIPVFLFDIFEIEDDIKELVKKNFELGLHIVIESQDPVRLALMQFNFIKNYLGIDVKGVRAHGLIFNKDVVKTLSNRGILYDSTIRIVEPNGKGWDYLPDLGVYELYLTLMDTDVFGRFKLSEDKAWKYITWLIEWYLNTPDVEVLVILFHQESFRMKGGRMYGRLLDWLCSRDNVKIMRCIDFINYLIGKKYKKEEH